MLRDARGARYTLDQVCNSRVLLLCSPARADAAPPMALNTSHAHSRHVHQPRDELRREHVWHHHDWKSNDRRH